MKRVPRALVRRVLIFGVLLLAVALTTAGCGARTGAVNAGWTVVSAADDVVYAVLSSGTVVALDAANGSEVWHYPPETNQPSGIGAIFSRPDPDAPAPLEAVYGAPVVEDELLVVSSMDGSLYAFARETGEVAWEYQVPGAVIGSVTVADGVAYFGATDNRVYALDLATRELVWAQPFEAEDWIWSEPAVDAERVYVGAMDQHVYALNRATGEPLWRFRAGGAIPGAVTLADGLVIAGSIDSNVYALDAATGDLRWTTPVGHWAMGKPLVDGDYAYVTSLDGKLHALSLADGTPRWDAASLHGPVRAGPEMVDGYLVVGSDRGEFWRVEAATGQAQRLYPDVGEPGTDSGVGAMLSAPASAGDTVYVGTAAGRVLALSADPAQGELWTYSAN